VIYAQGFLDAGVEEEIASVAPTVFFAHSYYGTCISGDKTHKFPWVQPCDRVFGAACLAYYFPRRCGGRSPLTMVREYDRQRRRLALLRRCAAVLTHSEHMRREFARHGAAGGRVYNISYSVTGAEAAMPPSRLRQRDAAPAAWRVMFIGRMNRLKGGRYLLDALPAVQRQVDRPLHVTFAGDGPARHDWEKRARQIRGRHATVSIEFAGWLQHDQLALRLDTTDLVVVPSLWPEPFGLVGPEANRRGIPVVAYATGGIPDWLHDGVNGCLAPGNPPTVAGLVEAMVRCLRSVETSDALRRGALEMGHARADDVHVDGLLEILGGAAAGTGPTRA
jgi:glycosyltransferase involved in cell wall biosynthesis